MTLFRNIAACLALTSGLSVAACNDDGDDMPPTTTETTALTPAMEFPAPMGASAATGTFQYTLDNITRVMSYTLTVSNLTGPATGAHIHEGAVGVAGDVALPLMLPTTGTVMGTLTLSADQVVKLKVGAFYVNVHTQANPAGEIRGQLDGK